MMVRKKRSDFILRFSACFLGHRAGWLAGVYSELLSAFKRSCKKVRYRIGV